MADHSPLDTSRHRLETALGRLEAIVLRRVAAEGETRSLRRAYDALQARHALLERSTATALERLDRLISVGAEER